MLYANGKPKQDAKGKNILYKAPTHYLRRFGYHISKLIPKAQCSSKFGPKSKLGCIMVGYIHDSTTTCQAQDPEFKMVNTQFDIIFNEEWNTFITCPPLPTNEKSATNTLSLQREEIYVEELERTDVHEGS